MSISILSGPYGTRIAERTKGRRNDFSHPAAILNSSDFRQELFAVAQEHLRAGTNVTATHSFGLRQLFYGCGAAGIT